MGEPKFEIFAGTPGKHVWIEAVCGLSNARQRMEEISKQMPGRYFIFSIVSRTILAQIETFEKRESPSELTWGRVTEMRAPCIDPTAE